MAEYAVAYVVADEPMKVTLALSTNDQGMGLNGQQVFKFAETRTLEKDTDKVEVALTKGQNLLVLKVINEVNNWQACARFLKDGAPVKTLGGLARAPVGIARGVLTVWRTLRARLTALVADLKFPRCSRCRSSSRHRAGFSSVPGIRGRLRPQTRGPTRCGPWNTRPAPASARPRPDEFLYQSLSASEKTKSNGPGSAGTIWCASPSRASM